VLIWQRDFAAVIKLRLLRWEDYPGLPGGPDVITTIEKRQELESKMR